MDATNVATGEIKAVIRERRGVIWCPFCDQSKQVNHGGMFCNGCNATFTDSQEEAVEEAPEETAPTPTRRSRTTE